MEHFNIDEIKSLRHQFINMILQRYEGNDVIKYIGEMDPTDIPPQPMEELKRQTKGTEILIEYHLFALLNLNTQVIQQWRLLKQ